MGSVLWHSWVSCHLVCQDPTSECWYKLLHFQSSILLRCLETQQKMLHANVWGPVTQVGDLVVLVSQAMALTSYTTMLIHNMTLRLTLHSHKPCTEVTFPKKFLFAQRFSTTENSKNSSARTVTGVSYFPVISAHKEARTTVWNTETLPHCAFHFSSVLIFHLLQGLSSELPLLPVAYPYA